MQELAPRTLLIVFFELSLLSLLVDALRFLCVCRRGWDSLGTPPQVPLSYIYPLYSPCGFTWGSSLRQLLPSRGQVLPSLFPLQERRVWLELLSALGQPLDMALWAQSLKIYCPFMGFMSYPLPGVCYLAVSWDGSRSGVFCSSLLLNWPTSVTSSRCME